MLNLSLGLGIGGQRPLSGGGGGGGGPSYFKAREHNANNATSGATWTNEAAQGVAAGVPDFTNSTGSNLVPLVTGGGGGKSFVQDTDGQFMSTDSAYADIVNVELFVLAKTASGFGNGTVLSSALHGSYVAVARTSLSFIGPIAGDSGGSEIPWNAALSLSGLPINTWIVLHGVLRATGTSSLKAYNSSETLITSATTTNPVHTEGLSGGLPMEKLFGGVNRGNGIQALITYSLDAGDQQSTSDAATIISTLAGRISTL